MSQSHHHRNPLVSLPLSSARTLSLFTRHLPFKSPRHLLISLDRPTAVIFRPPRSSLRAEEASSYLLNNFPMVSLRRRKLLGLCSGRSYFFAPIPKAPDVNASENPNQQHIRSVSVHPLPLNGSRKPEEEKSTTSVAGTSNLSGSSSSKEQRNVEIPVLTEQPIKRRKRHRRKHHQNQEQCVMRGVYFKNMKWQAAIKVDKKQIHLGTVGSQVDAAHLYDRAAFMCGREPNFELSEEEKQELRKLNWEEFLAMTRHAITHKKHKRVRRPDPSAMLDNSDWEGDQGGNSLSASDEMDQDDTF